MRYPRKPTPVFVALLSSFLLLSFAWIEPALPAWTGSTYYVSPDGSDDTGDGTEGNPWRTIGKAVTEASAINNDIIEVISDETPATDDYVENILVDKPVTIRSYVLNTYDPRVKANDYAEHVFSVTSDGVTIHALEIYGAATSGKAGIYLNNVSGCTISQNACGWDSTTYWNMIGILVNGGSGNRIWYNSCSYNGTGVSIQGSSEGNTISGNYFGYSGIVGVDVLSGSNNVISGNTFYQNVYGVTVGASCQGNEVAGNDIESVEQGIGFFASVNRCYFNSFDTIAGSNVSSSTEGNLFEPPTKLGYWYSSELRKAPLGNYYNDYGGTDSDGDGIGDGAYIGANFNDYYPLIGAADPEIYTLDAWFLSNPVMYKGDMSKIGAAVTIAPESSQVWADDSAMGEARDFGAGVAAEQTTWTGRLSFTDAPAMNDQFTVDIGYADDSTGANFQAMGPEAVVTGDGNTSQFTFATNAQSFTVPADKHLAVRITGASANSGPFDARVGGSWSYISAPVEASSGATISGTVFRSDGVTTITGVEIRVAAWSGDPCNEPSYHGYVDINQVDGTYAFSGLPAGTYFLKSDTYENYLDMWYNLNGSTLNCAQAQAIVVEAGQVLPDIDFQLDQEATVSGTVYDSVGQPITNTEITVIAITGDPCGTHDWQGSADVNQVDGTYTIHRLPAATNYHLETATQAGYLNEWWGSGSSSPNCENAGAFALAEGDEPAGMDFQLDREATISGTIFGADGTTLITGTEVCVNVYMGNPCGVKEWMASACTNPPSSASYTVRKLVAGEYYLETGGQETYPNEWWADPNSSPDCQNAMLITVAEGNTLMGKNFQLGGPTITSFTPASGGTGTVVTITGTNFTGATSVIFGGTAAASFTVNSATQITATVGTGATGKVSVTTPGGTTNSTGDFTFISAPTITSFSPTSGGTGTTVTINGTNFTGATAVKFGVTNASAFTVDSPTKITATVGSGSTGKVTVTKDGDTATSTGDFTYIPAPTISSFTPTSGGAGTIVVITGTNFTGTEVKFGGTDAASFEVDSSTQITAVVGNGSTGKVTVTTDGGTGTSAGDFTYNGVYPSVYWVDIQNGSDSNNGRQETPWGTIHNGILQINGGSPGTASSQYTLIVKIGGGTHYSTGTGEPDSELVVSQDYVRIIGETGSGPVIDGTGAENWTTGLTIEGSHVRVDNLYITNFSANGGMGIEFNSGSDNIVENCKLYGNDEGVNFGSGTSDNTLQDCEISKNNRGVVCYSSNKIIRNTIHGNQNDGVFVENASPEIRRNAIYDNTFGICVNGKETGTASPLIVNNLIYEHTADKVDFGIHLGGSDTSAINPKIYHNTMDGGTYEGVLIEAYDSSAINPEIKYNIITNFEQYGIENSGGNPVIDYNDVWNNAGANYKDCTHLGHDISEDPQYGSYQLKSTSPCIDKIPKSIPPGPPADDPVVIDYEGFKRPKGDGYDMGAYEYVVATATFNYTLPGGTGAATDYRIFTVPLDLGKGSNMLGQMEAVLGTYVAGGKGRWRSFAYLGTNYLEMNSSGFANLDIKPGRGYWIITLDADVIPFQGRPAPDGIDHRIVLTPGWHLIGLPWISTEINLGNIYVRDWMNKYPITSTDNNLTQRFVWDYAGASGYAQRNSATYALQCGKGYWIKVLADHFVTLIIPSENQAPESLGHTAPENLSSPSGDGEEPPPPPGAEPIPGVTFNSPAGSMTVVSGTPVSVAVTLDAGAWAGRDADWWVAAHTPFAAPYDWYSYVHPQGWRPGIHRCVKTPLFDIASPFQVLNMPLQPGEYTFYFAVDGNADGTPDVTWMDSVDVTVE